MLYYVSAMFISSIHKERKIEPFLRWMIIALFLLLIDQNAGFSVSLEIQIVQWLFSFAAFHDALGDTIALSISTPKHLQTLGLIQRPVDDTAHDINFLFTLAMDKVPLFFQLSLISRAENLHAQNYSTELHFTLNRSFFYHLH